MNVLCCRWELLGVLSPDSINPYILSINLLAVEAQYNMYLFSFKFLNKECKIVFMFVRLGVYVESEFIYVN